MVWFEYVLEALQTGTDSVSEPTTPGTPKTPKIDPRHYIDEHEAIDLYFYLKQVVYDACYEGMILNEKDFSSFAINEMINTHRFNSPIVNMEHYRTWGYVYNGIINMIHDYLGTSLHCMGKKFGVPKKVLKRFIYHYSDGFISEA